MPLWQNTKFILQECRKHTTYIMVPSCYQNMAYMRFHAWYVIFSFSRQAYFYENLHVCKDSYTPSFGGSLNDLLLKINSARRDDLLIPGNAPSTASRFVNVRDSDTSPNCTDAKVCPLNYFRKNRVFVYTLPIDHPDLVDLDKYKVAEILLNFKVSVMTSSNGITSRITGPLWWESNGQRCIHP